MEGRTQTRLGAWRAALLAVAVVLLLAATFRTAVEGDGVGYMAYLHSIWVDHDLNFSDEYSAALAAKVPVNQSLLGVHTATGRVANYFPVGTALLASPLYLVALALHPSGRPQYGMPFSAACTLASLLAGLLALALCWRLTSSLLAVAGVALCTPYVFYLLYAPAYSHMFSALAVSLFVYAWWRGREERGVAGWLVLGLLGGLMALVRFQDGVLLSIVLLDLRRAGWRVLLVLPGAALAFGPQLVVDQAVFGSLLPQRPPGQDLSLLPVYALKVLFSSRSGLFIWHPLTLGALVGMALVRDRALRAACLLAFLLETLVNGAAPDWWGGLAFGARRFLDLTPFFAIGLGSLAQAVDRRLAWGAVVLLAAWNLLLAANLIYVIRYDHDPGYLGLLAGQVKAVGRLPNLFVKGEVLRDLLLWPLLGRLPAPAAGLALLIGQTLAVGLAAAVALVRRPGKLFSLHTELPL